MTSQTPCMGGFCTRRIACAHYWSETYGMSKEDISERLCTPGTQDRFQQCGIVNIVNYAKKVTE